MAKGISNATVPMGGVFVRKPGAPGWHSLLEGNSLLSVWRDVLVLVGWSAVSLVLS